MLPGRLRCSATDLLQYLDRCRRRVAPVRAEWRLPLKIVFVVAYHVVVARMMHMTAGVLLNCAASIITEHNQSFLSPSSLVAVNCEATGRNDPPSLGVR